MNKISLYISILSLIVLVGACQPKEPDNVEVISMEELMGDGDAADIDTTLELRDTLPVYSTVLGHLVVTLNESYDTVSLNENHVFDRYGFNSAEKVKFIGKETVPYGKTNMVTPKAEFYLYNFSDSIKLNNAFYNWLDCFGSDCDEVKLNQDVEAVKTPPSFTLVYDTTMISVKYLCEHEKNDWESFQDSILKQYGDNYRYRIDVGCGGPLKWK